MQTKKSTLFFFNVIVITIVSCIANIAFAQENEATSTASSVATTTVATTTEVAPIIKEETTPLRTRISERELPLQVQVRITNLVANISNRIEAAHERLSTITKRAESRSQKLALAEYDTSTVDGYLNETSVHLETVKMSMSNIDQQVKNAITSETPKEAWVTIRALFVENVRELQNAKVALRSALSEMKLVISENRLKQTQIATSTPEQTEAVSEEIAQ